MQSLWLVSGRTAVLVVGMAGERSATDIREGRRGGGVDHVLEGEGHPEPFREPPRHGTGEVCQTRAHEGPGGRGMAVMEDTAGPGHRQSRSLVCVSWSDEHKYNTTISTAQSSDHIIYIALTGAGPVGTPWRTRPPPSLPEAW